MELLKKQNLALQEVKYFCLIFKKWPFFSFDLLFPNNFMVSIASF